MLDAVTSWHPHPTLLFVLLPVLSTHKKYCYVMYFCYVISFFKCNCLFSRLEIGSKLVPFHLDPCFVAKDMTCVSLANTNSGFTPTTKSSEFRMHILILVFIMFYWIDFKSHLKPPRFHAKPPGNHVLLVKHRGAGDWYTISIVI